MVQVINYPSLFQYSFLHVKYMPTGRFTCTPRPPSCVLITQAQGQAGGEQGWPANSRGNAPRGAPRACRKCSSCASFASLSQVRYAAVSPAGVRRSSAADAEPNVAPPPAGPPGGPPRPLVLAAGPTATLTRTWLRSPARASA